MRWQNIFWLISCEFNLLALMASVHGDAVVLLAGNIALRARQRQRYWQVPALLRHIYKE